MGPGPARCTDGPPHRQLRPGSIPRDARNQKGTAPRRHLGEHLGFKGESSGNCRSRAAAAFLVGRRVGDSMPPGRNGPDRCVGDSGRQAAPRSRAGRDRTPSGGLRDAALALHPVTRARVPPPIRSAPAPCRSTRWCPEPDLNRHAREGAARFKLAVSAFHHPGRPWAPRRVLRAYRGTSPEQGAGVPMLSYFIGA